MRKELLNFLICPNTGSQLQLKIEKMDENNDVIQGVLINDNHYEYHIKDGLPDMVHENELIGDARFARNYYTYIANTYDENLHVTFDLYNDKEASTREFLISLLNLKSDNKVLEVSAGTGKDSELIAKKLDKQGSLTLLDITPSMLKRAKENLNECTASIDYIVGTACSLPFPDNTFDVLYCFTGVGHFPDVKRALKEMARVVKTGGKVVFCEKNVPAWLRDTQYGKILINNNPMFAQDIPLNHIPVEARNVGVHWILGNVHYVVDFTVGEGEPVGNFDLELPGERGGSFNTRYFGKLEGITPEAKELALKAREKTGISMHKWLDEIITREAKKILGNT